MSDPNNPNYSLDQPPPPVQPAGWYPDPELQGFIRHWDGTRWSDHPDGRKPASGLGHPTAAAPPTPQRGGPNKALIVGGLILLLIIVGAISNGGDEPPTDDLANSAGSRPDDEPEAEPVEVPDVVGDGYLVAERTLETAGFEVDRNTTITEDVDEGDVVWQKPEPGEDAAEGDTVIVAVAEEPAPVLPDPKASFSGNCDYLLGNFESNDPKGYRFVFGGRVENTGNVGITGEVIGIFEQIGTKPVRVTKNVRVDAGKTRRVNATHLATQDEIDMHQSADSECRFKFNLLDTYGSPEE